jgi:hypothetical protein
MIPNDAATVKLSRVTDRPFTLRQRRYGFGTYSFVDYFHGYGESLQFNRNTTAVRAGHALVC